MRSRASSASPPRASKADATCWCSRPRHARRRRPRKPGRSAKSAPPRFASRAARTAMQLSDSTAPQRILLPVRAGTILGSLALALLANFLPWKNVALAPDFVALVLVFWCVRQPRLVGLGAGWLLGLLIDVGNGVLLGQQDRKSVV